MNMLRRRLLSVTLPALGNSCGTSQLGVLLYVVPPCLWFHIFGSTVKRWCSSTIVFSVWRKSICIWACTVKPVLFKGQTVLDNVKMKNICALNTLLWRWKSKAQVEDIYIHIHTRKIDYIYSVNYPEAKWEYIWTNTSQRELQLGNKLERCSTHRTQGNANSNLNRYHCSSAGIGENVSLSINSKLLKMCALVQEDASKEVHS